MWTMWFIYYMHVNHLYTVYSNLGVYTDKPDASLVINRMELGMHITRYIHVNMSRLLKDWEKEYAVFPAKPVRLDWDGTYIRDDRQYK